MHILHIVTFCKNVSIKTSLFYAIIGAYTCTFSNNLSFVWYFGFWAHSLVGLVTKKSFEWQKKKLSAKINAMSILSENKTLLIEEIRPGCGRVVLLITSKLAVKYQLLLQRFL